LLEKGEYVDNQYSALGLTLSASGGEGTRPRVLDTADPGGETPDACGDADLGSPNEACTPSGPGKGKEGKPNGNGPNCNPLGNVLIIQEPGESCPDDNVDGGVIEFQFDPPAEYVKNIGLLDVDYATVIKISFINEEGEMDETNIVVPILGDNSYQLLSLDVNDVTGPVKSVSLNTTRSAGISSLTFCYPPVVTSPTPAVEPTPAVGPTPETLPTPAGLTPAPPTPGTPTASLPTFARPTKVPGPEPTPGGGSEPTPGGGSEPTPGGGSEPTAGSGPTPAVEPTAGATPAPPTPSAVPTPASEPTPVTVPTTAIEPTPGVEPTPPYSLC
jgi:hypothetical protein